MRVDCVLWHSSLSDDSAIMKTLSSLAIYRHLASLVDVWEDQNVLYWHCVALIVYLDDVL